MVDLWLAVVLGADPVWMPDAFADASPSCKDAIVAVEQAGSMTACKEKWTVMLSTCNSTVQNMDKSDPVKSLLRVERRGVLVCKAVAAAKQADRVCRSLEVVESICKHENLWGCETALSTIPLCRADPCEFAIEAFEKNVEPGDCAALRERATAECPAELISNLDLPTACAENSCAGERTSTNACNIKMQDPQRSWMIGAVGAGGVLAVGGAITVPVVLQTWNTRADRNVAGLRAGYAVGWAALLSGTALLVTSAVLYDKRRKEKHRRSAGQAVLELAAGLPVAF